MKKINKTVLLASTLFITSAINLTDKAYANEDEKLFVKESVDSIKDNSQELIDNSQQTPDVSNEIESKSYTNLDDLGAKPEEDSSTTSPEVSNDTPEQSNETEDDSKMGISRLFVLILVFSCIKG